VWVGTSYVSLGEHRKAAAIFASVPDPGEQGDPKLVQQYRRCQLYRLQALREAAAAETEAAARAAAFAEADKVLQEVMKHPWAKSHPQFLQESILLLQAQGKYSGPAGAIARWDGLLKALEPRIDTVPLFRTVYNDAHINRIYCLYMEAKQIGTPEAMERVARILNPLLSNDELRPRLEEFVNRPEHKDLKNELDKLRKNLSG
jgi:hypothetical protein